VRTAGWRSGPADWRTGEKSRGGLRFANPSAHVCNRITVVHENPNRIATANFDTRAASSRARFWRRRSPAAPQLAGSRPLARLHSIRARPPRGFSPFRAPAASTPRRDQQGMSEPERRSRGAIESRCLISLDERLVGTRPKRRPFARLRPSSIWRRRMLAKPLRSGPILAPRRRRERPPQRR
jgi:hypothetical protein